MLKLLERINLGTRTMVAICFFVPSGILFKLAKWAAPSEEIVKALVLGHVITARERWGHGWEDSFVESLKQAESAKRKIRSEAGR